MRVFILVFHLMLTISMIVMILIQRSEGGGLGLGGGGNMGGLMTTRGTSNFLTRVTAILAALFIGTNLLLAILARQETNKKIIPVTAPAASVERVLENPPVSKDGKSASQKPNSQAEKEKTPLK